MKSFHSALLLTLLFWLSAYSRSTFAAEPFWARGQNQDAARRVNDDEQIAVNNPPGATTSKTRLDALSSLRTRLGASEGLPIETRVSSTPVSDANVVANTFDKNGLITGIWAYRSGGLRKRDSAGADVTVRKFILENPSLYDLHGSDARLPEDLDWLGSPETIATPVPLNRKQERLTYQQSYRGLRIIDGDIVASFIDDMLVSVTGTLINPAKNLGATEALVSESVATENAKAALSAKYGFPFIVFSSEIGLLQESKLVAYQLLAAPVQSREGIKIQSLIVDAAIGRVVAVDSAIPQQAATSSQFRIYRPLTTDVNPVMPNQTDVWHFGYYDENESYPATVYPWWYAGWNPSGGGWSFSTSITVGSEVSTFTQSESSPHFLASPGTAQFRQQHSSYWMSRALAWADAMFSATSPALGYRDRSIRVIQDTPFSEFSRYPQYCETTTIFVNDWCVRLGTEWVYSGNVPWIALVFHELGHAFDAKYTGNNDRWVNPTEGPDADTVCTPGTSEEAQSLGEGIASSMSMIMFLQEFGSGTSFTDYEATAIGVEPNLRYLMSGSTKVHMNDTSIRCYARPGAVPCSSTHAFSDSLLQPFWESAHGRNCGGDPPTPCVSLNDGATYAAAFYALAYATATTGYTGTQPQFAGNLLVWYYYFQPSYVWANRWWIFNHHRLVGPNYGYSPCHEY